MVREERWRLCGTVALDPKNPQWCCCRNFYPFHRPTQRCCQAFDTEIFFIVPLDHKKLDADDCKTYAQGALGRRCPTSSSPFWSSSAWGATETLSSLLLFTLMKSKKKSKLYY